MNEGTQQMSDLQEKILAILPLPSAAISIIGSSIIICIALQSRKQKQWTPYTRLLVSMSLCDIFYSISFSISAFLRPKDSSTFAYAMGNDASCTASGFLNQLSMSAIFFNAALSFYFLATARFGVSANQFSRRIEPIIYLISIGHPLLTASLGAYMGLYSERWGVMGCWIEFDKRCASGDPEIRAQADSCHYAYTSTTFYVLPAGFTMIALLVNNLIISRFVSAHVKPSRRHSGLQDSDMDTRNQLTIQKAQLRRLKLVKSQAFLFVASYFLCNFWSVVMAFGEFFARTDQAELEMMLRYYPAAVLQAVFLPLQGMLNMLVFVRPKYLKWRSEYPWESRWWAFQRSVFGESVRPIMGPPPSKSKGEMEELPCSVDSMEMEDSGDASHTSATSSVYSPRRRENISSLTASQGDFDSGDATNNAGIHYTSSRTRENISTLTASVGDFDHVIDDDILDERWSPYRLRPCPPKSRFKQSTSSGTWGSSLEAISENAESTFDVSFTAASTVSSVVTAKKQQTTLAAMESAPIKQAQREGRWSPSVISPSNSPRGRIRKNEWASPRFEVSEDVDLSLSTSESSTSRWNSGSKESPRKHDVLGIPVTERLGSLNDTAPSPSSAPSVKKLSDQCSDNSVTSAPFLASLDVQLVPPKRRLSPPLFYPNDNTADDSRREDDSSESSEERRA